MTAAQTKRQRRFLERYGPWARVRIMGKVMQGMAIS
jgi:hypothetical protein